MQNFDVWFDHGLGDCVQFITLLQLYKKYKFVPRIHFEENKRPLFEMVDLPYIDLTPAVPYHNWRYYANFNKPNALQDGFGSKLYLNLNTQCLPYLGESDHIWEELVKIRIRPKIPQQYIDQANEFVQDLPRPIILLHSTGTNLTYEKNIPRGDLIPLWESLAQNFGVVELDFDDRVPRYQHTNFRNLCRNWKKLNLWELAGLFSLPEVVFAGVDSGPLHFSHWFDLPQLGIFHHFYPSCVALPSENRACLTRNAETYRVCNHPRRRRWSILEYEGEYPSVDTLVKHITRLASSNKYVYQKGRDLLLQQMLDWQECHFTSTGKTDRNVTFDYVLRTKPKTIIETGTQRSRDDASAGMSTTLFQLYSEANDAKFLSIDNDPTKCDFSLAETKANVICMDSVKYLKAFHNPIDLVYLDSMDCEHPDHQQHCLAEAKEAGRFAKYILIDDSPGEKGKGALATPFLLENGFSLILDRYQKLFFRE